MFKRYKTELDVVEAIQYTEANIKEVVEFVGGKITVSKNTSEIQTADEESLTVAFGEYIVKDSYGLFCSIAPALFEQYYKEIK